MDGASWGTKRCPTSYSRSSRLGRSGVLARAGPHDGKSRDPRPSRRVRTSRSSGDPNARDMRMVGRSVSPLPGLLAATAVLAACAGGTDPRLDLGPVEDEYALVRVGTSALPVRVANETWIADTIRFHEGGTWSRAQVVRL